ncbi:MAG TPA: 30S ribosomal protein S9 [Bacteroidia bacterium]|jgi:small subunit ribosomal protein S9|nr:30S ribosomal protein S9 [Bacteroidia bacterium]
MDITHTIGRRKTAVARIYLQPGNGDIKINKKNYKEYFTTLPLQYIIQHALEVSNLKDAYDINVNVEGGGISGQAEATRLAIARALVKINPEYKPALKANGLLTRDPRMVERKKPGQKKARKRFQFSKR